MISTFPLSTIHGMLTLNTKRLTQEEKQQLAFPTILLLDEYYFCISNIDFFFWAWQIPPVSHLWSISAASWTRSDHVTEVSLQIYLPMIIYLPKRILILPVILAWKLALDDAWHFIPSKRWFRRCNFSEEQAEWWEQQDRRMFKLLFLAGHACC